MMNFDDVKACFTILDAWKELNLSGQPNKSCRCPWRDDRHPSFSVFDEGRRFKDFSSDENGDVGDFVARVLGWSIKEALAWCRERAEIKYLIDPNPAIRPLKKEEKRRELVLPDISIGGQSEWQLVAKLRGIHPYAVEVAAKLDVLVFGDVCGFPCWILHEPAIIAEARRMDGKSFPAVGTLGERKAHTLAGSRKDWPLGAKLLQNKPSGVMMLEGGPDWLAALHFLVMRKRMDLVPVSMMGRSNRIAQDALPIFKGRRVRIYPHDDPDGGGLVAALRWSEQLRKFDCRVDGFTFDGLKRGDGQFAKDLNDAATCCGEEKHKLEGLLP